MKIGILTLPLHTNYGGILQAYALQTVLERMGHEVEVIDKAPFRTLKFYLKPFAYTKRAIQKYIQKKDIKILNEQYFNYTYPIISQHIGTFIKKNIKRKEIKTLSQINENEYDAIIVGSDQIWRPHYCPYTIEDAYLQFAKTWHIKRLSYAASFGTSIWEYSKKQTQHCAALLHLFNAVSVREDSGVEICAKKFNICAKHVLDPTMLLTADDYIALCTKAKVQKSHGNLFYYLLDETKDKKDFINYFANEKRMIPFKVNFKCENKTFPTEYCIKPPIEEWIQGFMNAQFVITDSFHGCIFSIIFNKPFIVFDNQKRGSDRIISLLETFGLKENLILNKNKDPLTLPSTDYNKLNSKLENLRIDSVNFLSEYLTYETKKSI